MPSTFGKELKEALARHHAHLFRQSGFCQNLIHPLCHLIRREALGWREVGHEMPFRSISASFGLQDGCKISSPMVKIGFGLIQSPALHQKDSDTDVTPCLF